MRKGDGMSVNLCFKIGWYSTILTFGIMIIWFSFQLCYLCFFKKIKLEDAAEIIVEKATKLIERLERIPLKIQRTQLKMVNPEIEVYLQYYEMKIKSWLHKHGLV